MREGGKYEGEREREGGREGEKDEGGIEGRRVRRQYDGGRAGRGRRTHI